MTLAYGTPVQKEKDPIIKMAADALHTVGVAAVPGAFLVDIIPALKYVPGWVPGAGFQNLAKEFRKLQVKYRNQPYEGTVQHMVCLSVVFDTSKDPRHLNPLYATVIRHHKAMLYFQIP